MNFKKKNLLQVFLLFLYVRIYSLKINAKNPKNVNALISVLLFSACLFFYNIYLYILRPVLYLLDGNCTLAL